VVAFPFSYRRSVLILCLQGTGDDVELELDADTVVERQCVSLLRCRRFPACYSLGVLALARVFDLVAKVLAVEDTIYELDRGVENDVLNLSDFVKSVRRLARDQFEARALVQKIFHLQRQAAGAPPGFS